MTSGANQPYTGRKWVLAGLRVPGVREVVTQSLRLSTPYRAMILPGVISLVLVALARYALVLGRTGDIPPALALFVGVVVLWPAAMGAALGTDLLKKEHKFRTGRLAGP